MATVTKVEKRRSPNEARALLRNHAAEPKASTPIAKGTTPRASSPKL